MRGVLLHTSSALVAYKGARGELRVVRMALVMVAAGQVNLLARGARSPSGWSIDHGLSSDSSRVTTAALVIAGMA